MPLTEESLDGPPPDPIVLFTVLYGTYPCNFTAFLRDPVGYLRGKNWHGPSGDGDIALDSAAVKDRSTVRPSLLCSLEYDKLTTDHSLSFASTRCTRRCSRRTSRWS